jgi:AcrR family transcriptional regulator
MPTNKGSAGSTSRRTRRSSAEVHSRILSAAVELFAERGYGESTTREIARRADVAEQVIFRNYPTKQALFDAAVIEPFDHFLSEYTARWLAAPVPGGTPEEVLDQFVTELHDLVYENRQLVAALAASGSLANRTQPALTKLEKMGAVIADTHDLPFDPELSVRIAAIMVVAVTMLEDQLFTGAGDRLVAEMVRMLVGAARYIPADRSRRLKALGDS